MRAEEIALRFAEIIGKSKRFRKLKYKETIELGHLFIDMYKLYIEERNKNEKGEE